MEQLAVNQGAATLGRQAKLLAHTMLSQGGLRCFISHFNLRSRWASGVRGYGFLGRCVEYFFAHFNKVLGLKCKIEVAFGEHEHRNRTNGATTELRLVGLYWSCRAVSGSG